MYYIQKTLRCIEAIKPQIRCACVVSLHRRKLSIINYRNISQLDRHVGVVEGAVEENGHRQHEVHGHGGGEQ